MSEVRSMQLQKSALRFVRRWWPAALLPGLAVAALVGHGTSALRESLITTGTPATQPSSAVAAGPADNSGQTSVTVDGKSVPLDSNGSVNMSLPDGGQVTVSGGNTKVSDNNSGSGTSAAAPGSAGNVNVDVNSSGSNGNSWSSTQVSGVNNNTNGSSNSFSSTNVFSADSSYNDSSSE